MWSRRWFGAHTSVGISLGIVLGETEVTRNYAFVQWAPPPYIALSAASTPARDGREGEVAMLRRAAAMESGYRRREAAAWSCTESLGSESGDVGGCDVTEIVVVDNQQPPAAAEAEAEGPQTSSSSSPEKRRRTDQRRLPPAMPRAAEGPFMRAERRGGRLILIEVVRGPDRRREVFRASRADGRLQLRFAGVEEEEEAPDDAEPAPAETAESVATTSGGGGVVVSGYCCNGGGGGGGGFCQVAGGAGRRLEIGAVMGT